MFLNKRIDNGVQLFVSLRAKRSNLSERLLRRFAPRNDTHHFKLLLLFLFLTGAPAVFAQEQQDSLTSVLANLSQAASGGSESLLPSVGIPSLSSFSWPNVVGGFIFGSIGMVVFMYGKKERNYKPLVMGIVLMAYPYFITNTFWLYAAGIGLCFLCFYWRD